MGVTVTGGASHPNLLLNYGSDATAAEAKYLASIITQEFSSGSAAYVSSGGSSPNGYLVVDSTPDANTNGQAAPTDFYRAVVFLAPATVVGGSDSGQLVLGGSTGLNYYTPHDNGTIAVAGGDNAIGLAGTGNSFYGGAGNDTVGISGTDTVYAGTGSTLISFASTAAAVVNGSSSSNATLTVQGGNVAATVSGGGGTLTAYDAAGVYTGGRAGNNMILAGSSNAPGGPVTIYGGGAGDYLLSYSPGSEIHANGDGTTVGLFNGGDTVYSGNYTTVVDILAGVGNAADVNLGSGATTINVDSGLVSVTGGSGAMTFNGSPEAATIIGGTGSVTAFVTSGSVTGGTGGANKIIATGSQGATLTGAHDGDFIQAGSGNTSLVAGTADGTEALVAGSGQDTLVATTNQNYGTLLDFEHVSAAQAQTYTVENFNATGKSQLLFANQADVQYAINNQQVSGTNTFVYLNDAHTASIELKNSTVQLTTNNVKSIS